MTLANVPSNIAIISLSRGSFLPR